MAAEGITQGVSLTAVRSALSDKRLETYRLGDESDEVVLARYRWNLALGQSFYPSIGLLEVTLRNNLHRVIAGYYSNDRWYEDSDTLRDIEKEAVQKSKAQLQKDGKPEEPDRVVAELSFGFWTGLLRREYETQIWHRNNNLCKAFPNVPKKYRTRANIAGKLQDIRKLRNRISHHQPIFKMESLPQLDKNILEIIGWLSPNMLLLLPVGEAFVDVYARGHDAYAVPIRHANSASQTGAAAN